MTALVHEGILKFQVTTNIPRLFQGILSSIAVFCLTGADVKIPFQRRTAQQGRTIKIRCEVTGEDFLRWETPSRGASLGVPQLQAENITHYHAPLFLHQLLAPICLIRNFFLIQM